MTRRPLIISIIVICYVLSPVSSIFLSSIINRIPLFGAHNIFTRLPITDILILFVYPISAAAIYSIKKWGWYLFLACSLILISYNIFVYYLSPRYSLLILIVLNVILAIVAGIFFRKHIIAPYFNPRLRWWETEPRYKIEIHADIIFGKNVLTGEILDISNSGFFMSLDQDLTVGRVFKFNLKCLKCSVEVNGKVMRKSSRKEELNGYGVMFVKLTDAEKMGINALIKDLEKGGARDFSREGDGAVPAGSEAAELTHQRKTAARYKLLHEAILTSEKENIQCKIVNISKDGCFVTAGQDIPDGITFRIKLRCIKLEIEMKIEIKRKTEYRGVYSYAIKFISATKQDKKIVNMIIRKYKKIGARDRLKDSSPVSEEVIDRYVVNTPYRTVLFFKKLLYLYKHLLIKI
ncbi:MAG: PilZ domain-containing protein [Spirochaetes bacterium]|nr:PilZ domain-containing protein [Spirochaetota bacterium]